MRDQRLAALLLIALGLAACLPVRVPTPAPSATAAPTQNPIGDISYDSTPSTVVVYADIQPGLPSIDFGITCPPGGLSALRVWGDGLVFLDAAASGMGGPPLLTGRLSPSQMRDMLGYLSAQGYLGDWAGSPTAAPNTMGTYLNLGVHLQAISIEHGSGSFDWPFYADFANRLRSELSPLSLGPGTDERIASLNIGTRDCTTPTVAPTMDIPATVAVLQTQQPPNQTEHFVGICQCVPSGRVPPGLLVQNSWQRQLAGDWVLVEAGTLATSPTVGIIAVLRSLAGSWTFYPMPTDTGSVQISAEHDNRLTLQSVQGNTYYFDVPTLSLAGTLTQFIPTPPLPTPYPPPGTPTPPRPWVAYP